MLSLPLLLLLAVLLLLPVLFGLFLILRLRAQMAAGGGAAQQSAELEPQKTAFSPERFAETARHEALEGYHGGLKGLEPKLWPIASRFLGLKAEALDGRWAAAFVYHCLRLSGHSLPNRADLPGISGNFAEIEPWLEWARASECLFLPDGKGFAPKRGDIALFCLGGEEIDHMGVVLERNGPEIFLAEGDVGNVSLLTERLLDDRLKGLIRIGP
ncbi:MAG: hypothetical protein LBU47_04975 [Christensenellaceae bacterium]|jgi:hypothetical protein|nr:hypothetical protein [Christensenellaceae bacterium]